MRFGKMKWSMLVDLVVVVELEGKKRRSERMSVKVIEQKKRLDVRWVLAELLVLDHS